MNNTTARSYFWLFMPLAPGAIPHRFEPWHWVEIDFDKGQAELCPGSWPSLEGFDENVFWSQLEELGVWQWKTWEEETGKRFVYRAGERFVNQFLTIRHDGRERREIMLDGHPERVARLFRLVETIRRPRPLRPNGVSLRLAPGRYNCDRRFGRSNLIHEATVDFEKMEVSVNRGDGRGPKSIAGFDEEAFWRSVEKTGIWGWPQFDDLPQFSDLDCCSWHRSRQRQWLDVLTLSYGGVVREIPLTNQPGKLDEVFDLLAQFAFSPIVEMLETRRPTDFECVFPFIDSDRLDVQVGSINLDGEAASLLGKELDAVGFDRWDSDRSIPLASQRSWDGLEWEEIENRLSRGLPFVRPELPDSRGRHADKRRQLGPVLEALRDDDYDLGFRWGIRFNRNGRCQVVEGVDRRIDLVKLLAAHNYAETLSMPSCSIDYMDDIDVPQLTLASAHYLGLDEIGPAPVLSLQGETEQESFSYEVVGCVRAAGLMDARTAKRVQPICLLTARRKCFETGTTWTFERPVSVEGFRSMVENLKTANAQDWQKISGQPANCWSFRARLNGKVYECGGSALAEGGVESSEPDPRLSVLRKIVHFS